MKHARKGRELSRTAEHRKALMRNLVTELFRHERIETTLAKAKESRRLAERLITFAKRGDLHARRHVDRFVMSPEVTQKLFATIAPWYAERHGGYTRVIKTRHRLGDGGEMAFLELVKSDEQLAEEKKVREAAAAKLAEEKEAKAKAKGERTAKAKAEKADRPDRPAKPLRGGKANKPTGPGKMAKPRGTKKPDGGE